MLMRFLKRVDSVGPETETDSVSPLEMAVWSLVDSSVSTHRTSLQKLFDSSSVLVVNEVAPGNLMLDDSEEYSCAPVWPCRSS